MRNHITLNGDACLLQKFAEAVKLRANHHLASPKSSSRSLRRSTPLRRSYDDGLAAMAEGPNAALDHIRNKLQIILSRAELRKNTSQCESCAIAVSQIVNEIRNLEAFVREALQK
jgi:hypothetical protein